MDPYDFVMIGVLVIATLWGAMKGLAWQVASLASLALSYFLALQFSSQLATQFNGNRFLAMAVIFAVTSLAVWLAFRVVRGFIDRVKLQEFDRQLGLVFGLAKGVLLCVVITFFAVTLSEVARDHVLKSRSGYYIALLLDRSHEVMPEELHEVLEPYIDRLEKELEPAEKGGSPSGQPTGA